VTRIHTHSIRLPNGEELLVTRVVADNGRIGYGFSLETDATESRHMAEGGAGLRKQANRGIPPEIQAAIDSISWEDK
jgi:hypothetical protein